MKFKFIKLMSARFLVQFLVLSALCIANQATVAQIQLERSVVASGGITSAASGFSISYAIGEPAGTTLNGGSSWLTQGFHQPDLISVGTWEIPASQVAVSLFPNPFQSQLNISVTGETSGQLFVEIFDIAGKAVLYRDWHIPAGTATENLTVDVGFLSPASYQVRIANREHSVSKIFNVIKTY